MKCLRWTPLSVLQIICHKVCEVAVPESKYMGYSCSEVRIIILDFLSCKNFLPREHSAAEERPSRVCLTLTCFRRALTSEEMAMFKICFNLSPGGFRSGSSSCCPLTGWSGCKKSRSCRVTRVLVQVSTLSCRGREWKCLRCYNSDI